MRLDRKRTMFIHTNQPLITSFYIKKVLIFCRVSADPQFSAQRARDGVNRSGALVLSDSFSVPKDAIGDGISRKFFNKFRIPHSFVFLPHLELQHSDFPMFNVMVT